MAHDGLPLTGRGLWRTWSVEPWTVLPLVLWAWVYALGVGNLWRSAGRGRGVSPGRAAAFGAGWLVLVLALLSPIDALSRVLFSAHMVQHLLLMVVAPPLLVWGMPPAVLPWALPRASRRPLARWWQGQAWLHRLWRLLCRPGAVWGLHAAALWLWHMPRLYDAALQHEALHILEHASFFGTALLFWWTLLHHGSWRYGRGSSAGRPAGRLGNRLGRGAALLFVFTTALHSGLLGALITFAANPLYANYGAAYVTEQLGWGLTQLEDQQLAGVVMWFPVGLVYLATILTLLGSWLQEADQQEAHMAYRTDPS